jgi:hypothetical protein
MRLLGSNQDILPNIVPVDDKWENVNPKYFLSFSFFFLASFACLCHIMALSNDKTSCSFRCPSIANFVCKKRACLNGGLAYARTFGKQLNLQFWFPHSLTLPE